MVFGRDLQYGGDAVRVSINRMPNALSDALVDEDDIDVTPFDEGLERLLDVGIGGVFVHHQEVQGWLFRAVDLPDPTQQEADTRVFVSNDCDEFSSG